MKPLAPTADSPAKSPLAFLFHEVDVFLSHPRNMRVLLISNFVYAFVFPILDLFVTAYVMRNSNDTRLVMGYQMALYAGIPFAFFLNGYLLRLIPTRYLFSAGMILTSITMAALMSLPQLNVVTIGITGFLMGMCVGTYWSNRDFLALSSTEDSNRNYYYSLESFFGTLCGLIVPASVGWFIHEATTLQWFGPNQYFSYYILTAFVFALSCAASFFVCQGDFANPRPTRFVYWNFHRLWYPVLGMSLLRGLANGFSTAAPIILVARLMHGEEAVLGTMQSMGMFVAAVGMYIIARVAKPEHRLKILTVGLVLYMAATVTHAILFSAVGVVIYFFLQLLCRPLIETVVCQTVFRAIDTLEKIENRNSFTYIFNNEFGLLAGRLFGGFLFIAVAYYDETIALRYVLLAISTMQIGIYFCCKHINEECAVLNK